MANRSLYCYLKQYGGVLVFLVLFLAAPVMAQTEQSVPVTVNFFHPAQIYNSAYSVGAFRWNILYGVNQDISGLDMGIVNNANGNAQSLEIGVFNRVNQDFQGWQIGMVNQVNDDFNGLQAGVFANVTKGNFRGFQAALFVNSAQEEMHGLQLAIVNTTGSLNGIQIGLFNFNDDEKYLGFFPFIHAAF